MEITIDRLTQLEKRLNTLDAIDIYSDGHDNKFIVEFYANEQSKKVGVPVIVIEIYADNSTLALSGKIDSGSWIEQCATHAAAYKRAREFAIQHNLTDKLE